MWNLIPIQLDANGAGNGNLFLPGSKILGNVAIPVQPGINSGTTDVVVSHLFPQPPTTSFPNGLAPAAILTITNITTPYVNIPQKLPVDATNTAGTALVYQLIQSINVSITSGVANQLVYVLVLTDD